MLNGKILEERVINHAHLFCGLGGGARGFNRSSARHGKMVAKFNCLGGVDNDRAALKDFEKLAGVPGTHLDMFDREQYVAFHGQQPPRDWREATPADLHKAFQYKHPHIGFLSSPCKGLSGLLSETMSKTPKYQALNRLTLRGVWLLMEAYKDDPVELVIFENVPRIATRGRYLLDQIGALLRAYGYAVAETTHDCGEIGGLAQSRKRFLLVARHIAKVPPFLYEPPKRALRGVGEVLGKLPLPGDVDAAGPMHRIPALQWQTWVRLAFVKAGQDWRSLKDLAIDDGYLRDYLIVPQMQNSILGVRRWNEPAGAVAGRSSPTNGAYSVADPRFAESAKWNDGAAYGVNRWEDASPTIQGGTAPGQGRFAVADPRHEGPDKFSNCFKIADWKKPTGVVSGAAGASGGFVSDPRMDEGTDNTRHKNVFRIVAWDKPGGTISSGHGPSSGGHCVADPRPNNNRTFENIYRVTEWDKPSRTVIGKNQPADGGLCVADPRSQSTFEGSGKYNVTDWQDPAGTLIGASTTGHGAFAVADPRTELRSGGMGVHRWTDTSGTIAGESLPTNGAFAVADPRPSMDRKKGDAYLTGGHYGVVSWEDPTGAVSGSACHDNGRWSVADPRLPEKTDRMVCVIQSLDGTWHRPFTTLEKAALQSLVDPDDYLVLHGDSDSARQERIGNAVPSDSATAIGSVMGKTLLMAWSGVTFELSNTPIWVRPMAIALSVDTTDPILDIQPAHTGGFVYD